MLPIDAFFDELEKLGAVSAEEAHRSLEKLDAIDQSKPTLGQVGRYGALGAAAGAGTRLLGNALEHGALPTRRGALAGAVGGAIGMGAIPLVARQLDRKAEYGKLKKFMNQEHVGEYAPSPGAMTDSPMSSGLSKGADAKDVARSALEHGLQGVHGFLKHRIGPAIEAGSGVAHGDTREIARGVGGIASGAALYHVGKREGEHDAAMKKKK